MNRKPSRLIKGWYEKDYQRRYFIEYNNYGMIIYQTQSQYYDNNFSRRNTSQSHPYFDKWWIGSKYMSPTGDVYPVQLELFKEEDRDARDK